MNKVQVIGALANVHQILDAKGDKMITASGPRAEIHLNNLPFLLNQYFESSHSCIEWSIREDSDNFKGLKALIKESGCDRKEFESKREYIWYELDGSESSYVWGCMKLFNDDKAVDAAYGKLIVEVYVTSEAMSKFWAEFSDQSGIEGRLYSLGVNLNVPFFSTTETRSKIFQGSPDHADFLRGRPSITRGFSVAFGQSIGAYSN